jgi:hypothetical protein
MPATPTVTTDPSHRLVIEWPDPRPRTFEIDSEFFEMMINEMNAGRELSDTVTETTELTDELISVNDWFSRVVDVVQTVALVVIAAALL